MNASCIQSYTFQASLNSDRIMPAITAQYLILLVHWRSLFQNDLGWRIIIIWQNNLKVNRKESIYAKWILSTNPKQVSLQSMRCSELIWLMEFAIVQKVKFTPYWLLCLNITRNNTGIKMNHVPLFALQNDHKFLMIFPQTILWIACHTSIIAQ